MAGRIEQAGLCERVEIENLCADGGPDMRSAGAGKNAERQVLNREVAPVLDRNPRFQPRVARVVGRDRYRPTLEVAGKMRSAIRSSTGSEKLQLP